MAHRTSRGPYRMDNRAERVAALPHAHAHDHAAAGWLHEHLLRDHGRTERETNGLPLADLHRFEHVEQEMGLNVLGHRHPTGAGNDAGDHAAPGSQ